MTDAMAATDLTPGFCALAAITLAVHKSALQRTLPARLCVAIGRRCHLIESASKGRSSMLSWSLRTRRRGSLTVCHGTAALSSFIHTFGVS